MEQNWEDFYSLEENHKLDEQMYRINYETLQACYNIIRNSNRHSDFVLKIAKETNEQIIKDNLK